MSMVSPQQGAAGDAALWQSQLSQQLAGVSMPELQQLIGGDTWVEDNDKNLWGNPVGYRPGHWQNSRGMLGNALDSRDATGKMKMDRDAYAGALSQLNQGYGQAQNVSRERIAYGGLRSGLGATNAGAVSSGIRSAATSLERDQAAARRNLEFQSANASAQDYNKVLQLMGQGSNTALQLAGGFAGASTSAIAGMSNQSQFGSTIGGAATGASMGGSVAGGYGALAGAVIGGIGGYLGSG